MNKIKFENQEIIEIDLSRKDYTGNDILEIINNIENNKIKDIKDIILDLYKEYEKYYIDYYQIMDKVNVKSIRTDFITWFLVHKYCNRNDDEIDQV